jgi:hypothetical protein
MVRWGKESVCAPVLRHPPRSSPQRPNACANAGPDIPKGPHVSAGLLMGYVRLVVEQQSQWVPLDGLMRNGLASELKAGLPQKLLRKGRAEPRCGPRHGAYPPNRNGNSILTCQKIRHYREEWDL